jgi:peroxiredoxin
MKYVMVIGLLASFFLSCQQAPPAPTPQHGIWRGVLDLGPASLPFNFELTKEGDSYSLTVINDSERLAAESVTLRNDSLIISMAVFHTAFYLAIKDSMTLEGYWQDHSREPGYKLPFRAQAGEVSRFPVHSKSAPAAVAGKWAATFSPGIEGEEYPAVGVFEQEARKVTGTFLTETGDYRFLQGVADGDSLKLSAFDGSHAFLFLAGWSEDSLKGIFYSGTHWVEPWVAVRDEQAVLRNPDSLTFLNPGYDRMDFTFPDLAGNPVSLTDPKYPNCMDETKLFRQYYETYHDRGLEIVALAFERGPDQETAVRNLNRLKARFEVTYDFLLADFSGQPGITAEKLPMVNRVMAFPTSFFLDRNGRIRKIHTGFYGPGTGDLYTDFVRESSGFIEQLLAE